MQAKKKSQNYCSKKREKIPCSDFSSSFPSESSVSSFFFSFRQCHNYFFASKKSLSISFQQNSFFPASSSAPSFSNQCEIKIKSKEKTKSRINYAKFRWRNEKDTNFICISQIQCTNKTTKYKNFCNKNVEDKMR